MFGIGLKVGSVLIFLTMASFVKGVGDVPPGQIVFFRSFFAILPILVFLIARRNCCHRHEDQAADGASAARAASAPPAWASAFSP